MRMTQQPTPANWYPDPWDTTHSTLRWWDGQQWTGHTQPTPQGPPTAVTQQSAVQRLLSKATEVVSETVQAAHAQPKTPPKQGDKPMEIVNNPTIVVRILFRSITMPVPDDTEYAYSYLWPFKVKPDVGDRVLVIGYEGKPDYAVVVGIGTLKTTPKEYRLKPVSRILTHAEIEVAQKAEADDLNMWLDMMRKAAGLSTTTRKRNPPEGYPEIPPADGTARFETANKYGSAWWRAYKSARSKEEEDKFRHLAHRWYAIRDRDNPN